MLELATGIGIVALIAALFVPSPVWYIGVFMLVGISYAGYQLAGFTLVMAFSSEAERPTYIGLANTALAPVGALGPLLIAQLAAMAGYGSLFIVTASIGIVGLGLLRWWVPLLPGHREAS